MRALALVVLMALSTGAAAFSYSIRINGRIISEGDSLGFVIQVAGKPDRTVQLTDRRGVGIAERWEYYREGKTFLITTAGGKVTKTEELDD